MLGCFEIRFEPEFENQFWNPKKQSVVYFQLTCFSAMVDLILWFWTSLSSETWTFELIAKLSLYYAQQQKKVFKHRISAIQN